MEKYNLPHEETKRFEIYSGANVTQMPQLIKDGRVPLSVAGLMQRRLELRDDETGVKDFYVNNWFDTGDAVAYHPDGRVKVVLDSQHLRDMTPDSQRNLGALVLPSEAYESLEGEEFERGKLGKTGEWLSRADVKAHPIWRTLARDQALLDDYADYIFTEGERTFGYDNAMGVFTGSANGNTPELRAWLVGRAGDRSGAGGDGNLVSVSGRLVGVASETQE